MQVQANGITIEVEDHGKKTDPVILLIMGFSAQLTTWPEEFVQALVDGGFRVVRFDNRDVGLSHKFDGVPVKNPFWQMIVKRFLRGWKMAPYDLEAMAADSIGVLDALGIEKAHVIGASMGGMISQILAAKYPDRLTSLTAVMTSTNNPKLPRAKAEVQKVLFGMARSKAKTPEERLEVALSFVMAIQSPTEGRSREETTANILASAARSTYPEGPKRQMAAIIESGDLRRWTKKITAPTMVVHGQQDPLVLLACGKDVAANIEGSRLEIIDGMGHDFPPAKIVPVANLIIDHCKQAA